MNIDEEVKNYQACRRKSSDIADNIKQSAVEFYRDLESNMTFVDSIPNKLLHRKNKIKNEVANIVQSIDSLQKELEYLDVDCSLQIYQLISIKKMREEKQNVREPNATVAGRFDNKRKLSNLKARTR